MNKAIVGWGNGLTGPTTPTCGSVVCAGKDWPIIPVSRGHETLAIVVKQVNESKEQMMIRAQLIADALNK